MQVFVCLFVCFKISLFTDVDWAVEHHSITTVCIVQQPFLGEAILKTIY